MGTNFYYRRRKGLLGLFGKCEEKHIGKRSGGWQFSFRGYKGYSDDYALGMEKTIIIGSWRNWKRILKRGRIFDEYGKRWSYDDFVAMVEKSRGSQNHYDYTVETGHQYVYINFDGENWKDSEGWSFSSTEFC